jgi:hypothetical protein
MTERRFDCLCREGYATLLDASIVVWTSIGDKDNIARLSTRPVFLHNGGTVHVADPWLENVESEPSRAKVLLFELLVYGFGWGLHNWLEELKVDMK